MPSLELPNENGPLATPLNPPLAFFSLLASRLAALVASACFLASAATCSFVLSRSRAANSFAIASRSSLLLRPVKAGVLTPLFPRVVPPRPRTDGDADREGGTEPWRLPSLCTGARVDGSALGWGDATALLYVCQYCRQSRCGNRAYDAVAEGASETCDSMAADAPSSLMTGFASPSSCLGTTGSAAASEASAAAVLCGVASVDSLAPVVARPDTAPPLALPRARLAPRPLGFGGIAVIRVLLEGSAW